MAFAWTEDVGVGDSIDAADVNEIKTNLDSIYTALGITRPGQSPPCSGAGWTELPVSVGDDIVSVQFQEMRDVTDYAYDNKCPGYCNDENTGYQSGDQVGVDSSYCPGYCNDENTGYQSGDQVGVDGSYCPGYCSNQNTGYQGGDQVGVDGSYCPGYCSGQDGTNWSSYRLGYDSSNNLPYCSYDHSTVFGAEYNTVYSSGG